MVSLLRRTGSSDQGPSPLKGRGVPGGRERRNTEGWCGPGPSARSSFPLPARSLLFPRLGGPVLSQGSGSNPRPLRLVPRKEQPPGWEGLGWPSSLPAPHSVHLHLPRAMNVILSLGPGHSDLLTNHSEWHFHLVFVYTSMHCLGHLICCSFQLLYGRVCVHRLPNK